ncbi:hypothetical protein CWN53_24125 [Klebsiella pneumoniae]|nr:hypothetical protein CWN74_26420 [Klebsiella pneumoniae]PLK94231.1 hypothetical protein CWN67_12140 [Klebsiella pneumoniae]PLM03556.1 hypothetical protein CWN51_29755 [Klebsiella pneumoniae]PLN61919.1 hypothetical protein CWN53_24125 [Klebsiella pneumoniae]PLO25084.1 hypothetical protein CWN38_24170 [Klebsiella pneumoniae]
MFSLHYAHNVEVIIQNITIVNMFIIINPIDIFVFYDFWLWAVGFKSVIGVAIHSIWLNPRTMDINAS